MVADTATIPVSSSIGVLRSAATGSFVLALIFGVCWLGAIAGLGGVHAYIELFTTAPVDSGAALGVGIAVSLLFGALIGAATAASYRAFAFLGPR